MISVQNISKSFGSIQAVRDVSFTIESGQVVGFLGPNGAGKSTTMRMITGYLKPTSGKVQVEDIDVEKDPIAAQHLIGYLPESAAIYHEMVVLDFLQFMGKMRSLKTDFLKQRLKAVTEQCQLQTVLGRKIGELSKGFRQRVGLAQALLHDPKILILDEPTVGLDPNQIAEIRELIKEIGKSKTILLSTHILPEVSATCQRVIIIKQGQIVAQGQPEALIEEQAGQSSYQLTIRGELKSVQNELARLPQFLTLKVKASNDNVHSLQVDCQGSEDLGEAIFDLAVQKGWRLSQIHREQQTLETVFKDLTGT